jgi:hypothetical protein
MFQSDPCALRSVHGSLMLVSHGLRRRSVNPAFQREPGVTGTTLCRAGLYQREFTLLSLLATSDADNVMRQLLGKAIRPPNCALIAYDHVELLPAGHELGDLQRTAGATTSVQ